MKHSIVTISLLLSILFTTGNLKAEDDFPVLKGPYLGQKPPGMTPEVFAPGIVSTGASEFGSTFTPDGNAFYYAISGVPQTIVFMELQESGWTPPRIPPFSGKYSDWDLNLSPDGRKLYFTSNRPLSGKGPPIDNSNLWVVEKKGGGWSNPKNLGKPINTEGYENYPSVTKDGTLYFFHSKKKEDRNPDVYYSKLVDGKYSKPVRLSEAINSKYMEWDPFIASDESYLIFGSVDRPGGYGACDLYISYRKHDGDGTWTKAINMGDKINSKSHEFCPSVTPDEKYFFFMSKRRRTEKEYFEPPLTYEQKMKMVNSWGNGEGDIYWVDAQVIRDLRQKISTK
jgi:Tol biopolymer transport system component